MGFEIIQIKRSWWSTGLTIVAAILVIEILIARHWFASAWFEFCTHGGIVTVSSKDCPFGVLYKHPVEIGNCWYPQAGDHISDVCTDERDPEGTKKIQFVDSGPDDEDGPAAPGYESESCKDSSDGAEPEEKCSGDYMSVSKANAIGGDEVIEYPSENETMAGEEEDPNVDRANVNVRQQTLRLFLYLSGLLADENENMPVMRLVRLLKKSFDILRKYCHSRYVSHDFTKEILRSFLFLLREGDLAHVQDISVHEFSKINQVLDRCLKGSPPNPFYLVGTVCRASSKITGIIKTEGEAHRRFNQTHQIQKPTELSFKWGKYDVPIDATWSIMDFTHGMCYGTFKDDMNSHHLYEQALERLFTPELVYRWTRPIRLSMESFWDHMLRSYTDNSMKNMDACIQAAYIGSPYLHRLARPMVKQKKEGGGGGAESTRAPSGLSSSSSRKKRDISGLISSAWCFASQEERDDAMSKVKANC